MAQGAVEQPTLVPIRRELKHCNAKEAEIFRSEQAGKDDGSDKAETTIDNPHGKDPYPASDDSF